MLEFGRIIFIGFIAKTEELDNLVIFLKIYKEKPHGKEGILGIDAHTSVSAVF